ncbi:Trafficking kinesin-binding protein 1 [Trichinella zimbabwensis]|uniref:Trafficking kinesin-binding protein 1 n=1 Tax=Trichinella zimbabwensis TaxID=268475 RepID=A0A0V1HSH5_9BILA|nr:Trafficking kinesin-binding protein 1 [Trichinella zimbabwensis]
MDKKSYIEEVKEFINSAGLSQCNRDNQFRAGGRRLTSSSRLPFAKPTPYSTLALQQSLCVAKLSNEHAVNNYDISSTLDYLLFEIIMNFVDFDEETSALVAHFDESELDYFRQILIFLIRCFISKGVVCRSFSTFIQLLRRGKAFYVYEQVNFNQLMLHSQQVREMMESDNDNDTIAQSKNDEVQMAAQVGLILLKRNSELQQTNDNLEKKLMEANEEITQLKHELQLKLSLLRALAEEEEDQLMNAPYGGLSHEELQEKMRSLEEQNQRLQLEIGHLKEIVTSTADREELLTKRYRKHCSHFELKIQNLTEQLSEDKEVCMQQQAFIESLQKEMEQLDMLNSKLREENEELNQQLRSVQSMHCAVKAELRRMQQRYAELWETLTEAEDETKALVGDADLELSSSFAGSVYISLAAELQNHYNRSQRQQKKSSLGCQSVTQTPNLMRKALKWQVARDSPSSMVFDIPPSPLLIASPPSQSSRFMEMPSPLMMLMIESTPPPPTPLPPPPPSPPPQSSLAQSLWQNETDGKRCSELDLPSSESASSRCPTPEYGVPGVPGTKDLVRAIRRLKLKALQRSLSKIQPNTGSELAASTDSDEVDNSGGLFSRIQRWLTSSLMPSIEKASPQCSAACFVNTASTYSFVNSQVLHPQLDSRLYNLPGMLSASKFAFTSSSSSSFISMPPIVSGCRCYSGQEMNSVNMVNNANTKRGTVVVNGDSSCQWTAEPGSATSCTWIRQMVVLPVCNKLFTDGANQDTDSNTDNKAE